MDGGVTKAAVEEDGTGHVSIYYLRAAATFILVVLALVYCCVYIFMKSDGSKSEDTEASHEKSRRKAKSTDSKNKSKDKKITLKFELSDVNPR